MTHRFFTLTNAVSGDEAGYADWYVSRHLGDVVATPGVLGGQFFTAVQPEHARWRHLAIFEVDEQRVPMIFEAMSARAGGPEMPLHALDRESYYFLIGEPAGPWTGEEPGASNCRLLTLSRPQEGREADLVEWYETQHFADMLRIPGFLGAQRFCVQPSGRGNEPPWRFAALYAAQAEDPMDLVRAIDGRRGTDQMILTDALDRSVGETHLFRAITPHVTSKDVT